MSSVEVSAALQLHEIESKSWNIAYFILFIFLVVQMRFQEKELVKGLNGYVTCFLRRSVSNFCIYSVLNNI